MTNGERVVALIKSIVEGLNPSNFRIYLARVLTDTECSDTYHYLIGRDTCYDGQNLIIAVQAISDKSAESEISLTLPNGTLSNHDIPTIYPYVRLMCGVEDGPFVIPAQNSSVLIGVSNDLDPFIIQTSAVSFYNNSSITVDKSSSIKSLINALNGTITLATANDSTGAAVSGSEIRQEKDLITLEVTDGLTISYEPDGSFTPSITGANTTHIAQTTTTVDITAGGVPFTTQFHIDKDQIAFVKGGNELLFTDKFNVSNSAGDLHDTMSRVESNLNNINTQLLNLTTLLTTAFGSGSFGSAAAAYAAGIPTIISNIDIITSNLSILSTEINGLLG